jgi:hypothetical protein
MEEKFSNPIFAIIAILCLGIGVIGIAVNTKTPGTEDPLIVSQSQSVLALSLLSVGLFYRSNAMTFEKLRGAIILKYLGLCCIGFSILFIGWITIGSYIFYRQFFITPIFIAFLAIGLFFGNKVIKQ